MQKYTQAFVKQIFHTYTRRWEVWSLNLMFLSLTPILNRPAHPHIQRKNILPRGYFSLLCWLNEDLSCTSFNYQQKKSLKPLGWRKNMRIIDVHLKSTAKNTVDVAAQEHRAQKIWAEITDLIADFGILVNLSTLWSNVETFCKSCSSIGAFPLHGTARYGSVRFIFGRFSTGYSTWFFFSTISAVVPSDLYRYQNVTCKLYWSLIGRRESSLLCHWPCDMRLNIDSLDLNQHSQRRIGRTFLYQPKNVCFVVCWGSTDVPLVDSRGADPARAWWGDAE